MKTKIITLTFSLITCLLSYTNGQSPGDLDLGFGIDGAIIDGTAGNLIESFQDVVIQDDQKIVAVGNSWDDNYTGRVNVYRYWPDGSPDTEFGTNGKFIHELDNEALAYACTITPEGKIIIAGATTDYSSYRVLLLQINSDGLLDDNFGDNGVVVQQFSNAVENYED